MNCIDKYGTCEEDYCRCNQEENLLIAYGLKKVTLNKGEQHIILTNKDMAFIVQSVLKNIPLKINITD
jgi:hypothetical protein